MVVHKSKQSRIDVLPNDEVEDIKYVSECQEPTDKCIDILGGDNDYKHEEVRATIFENKVEITSKKTFSNVTSTEKLDGLNEEVEFIPLTIIREKNDCKCGLTNCPTPVGKMKQKQKGVHLLRNSLYFQNQAFDASTCFCPAETSNYNKIPKDDGSFVNHRYTNEEGELNLPKPCKQAWPVKDAEDTKSKITYNTWVSTADVEAESSDKQKLNKIINKVKCNFQYLKDSIANHLVQDITNDDGWSITIPNSLSIDAKDSDWSSQINDIEKSNSQHEQWVCHISSDKISRKSITEVNNNVCFDCGDIPLQEFHCSEFIDKKEVDELSLKEKYITSVETQDNDNDRSDWLFNIKNIRSNNPRDEVWTTIINATIMLT